MKISKQFLGGFGVGMLTCLLIAATIMVLHKPVVVQDNGWSGAQGIATTTPTIPLFPANGWWTTLMPVASPEGVSSPEGTSSNTPTPR